MKITRAMRAHAAEQIEKLTRSIASNLTPTTLDAVIKDLANVSGIGPRGKPVCGPLWSFYGRMIRQRLGIGREVTRKAELAVAKAAIH